MEPADQGEHAQLDVRRRDRSLDLRFEEATQGEHESREGHAAVRWKEFGRTRVDSKRRTTSLIPPESGSAMTRHLASLPPDLAPRVAQQLPSTTVSESWFETPKSAPTVSTARNWR